MVDFSDEEFVEQGLSHELDAPPWLRVESTLMATARLIRKAFDHELSALDLNLTSASLLMYVVEQGSLTQTALAERLGIGRAAAGLVIDRLEARELVERHPDTEDRRTWLIAGTAEGKTIAAEITEIDERVRFRLRRGVSRDERQQLAKVLVQLQTNLVAGDDR